MNLTAQEFIKKLEPMGSEEGRIKYGRYFKIGKGEYAEGDKFIGVSMGNVFALAKEFVEMPLEEIEKLLESEIHEVRTGAVSIMDFIARKNKTTEEQRKELFDLYIRRHDRINKWDLVDRSAQYVVGRYLFDKPRDILYKLVKSKNLWERRTAIFSTSYFLRNKQTEDTYKIAEILLNDKEDLIHKATGWMLRVAGEVNRDELKQFLNKCAAKMPRTMLRYSLEKFDKSNREYYMRMKSI